MANYQVVVEIVNRSVYQVEAASKALAEQAIRQGFFLANNVITTDTSVNRTVEVTEIH